MDDAQIRYALSKQVPCIEAGAVFETSYGTLHLEGDDAAEIAGLVKDILMRKRQGTAQEAAQ